ncbi:MAG: LPS assembly lipoprotein LptE [Elusimicrobiota bacterium]|jgi:TolB-like protein|nr:LPS assembly lipoprotein LptE [Elusimicrobiota bacterium]
MKNLVFLFFIFFLGSCSIYDINFEVTPGHEKKIYVKPFSNNTNQYGIEAPFTNAVIDEISNDGRIITVNSSDNTDGVLTAVIKRYILKPLTYDVDGVAEQYKLWIIVNVSFCNAETKEEIWSEDVEGIQIYIDALRRKIAPDIVNNVLTEEEARGLVWEKLSRKIIRKTIKQFAQQSKEIQDAKALKIQI